MLVCMSFITIQKYPLQHCGEMIQEESSALKQTLPQCFYHIKSSVVVDSKWMQTSWVCETMSMLQPIHDHDAFRKLVFEWVSEEPSYTHEAEYGAAETLQHRIVDRLYPSLKEWSGYFHALLLHFSRFLSLSERLALLSTVASAAASCNSKQREAFLYMLRFFRSTVKTVPLSQTPQEQLLQHSLHFLEGYKISVFKAVYVVPLIRYWRDKGTDMSFAVEDHAQNIFLTLLYRLLDIRLALHPNEDDKYCNLGFVRFLSKENNNMDEPNTSRFFFALTPAQQADSALQAMNNSKERKCIIEYLALYTHHFTASIMIPKLISYLYQHCATDMASAYIHLYPNTSCTLQEWLYKPCSLELRLDRAQELLHRIGFTSQN